MIEKARTSRKEAIREAKRTIILDAALAIFARDGLENASMRAIGDAAGYTAAAIYFHFESKEEIYAELLSQSLDRLIAAVESEAAKAETPAARFRAASMAFFDFYAAHPRDLDLGFYLFRGGMRPRGLSTAMDARLNSKLAQSLEPVSAAARGLGQSARQIPALTADIFAHAVGLLLMEHTGRIKVFGGQARKLMLQHLRRVLRDLGDET